MSYDQCQQQTHSGLPCERIAIKTDEHGRWTCGWSHEPPLASTKVGNNDHCPCGSGLKFKRCCKHARAATQ